MHQAYFFAAFTLFFCREFAALRIQQDDQHPNMRNTQLADEAEKLIARHGLSGEVANDVRKLIATSQPVLGQSYVEQLKVQTQIKAPAKSVYDVWDEYDGDEIMDKSPQYARVYDKYINEVVSGTPELRMLEIGVQSGGSAMAWKQYGVDYFVGLDIDPRCKRFESDGDKRYIEIGSQSNETLLKELCRKHGPFDVVIDDGGHWDYLINTSLRTIFPDDSCMKKDSVYFIEDMHVMYRCAEGQEDTSDMNNKCKKPSDMYEFIDPMYYAMHHHWAETHHVRKNGKLHTKYHEDPHKPVEKEWLEKIKSINLHESMIAIVRGKPEHVQFQRKGRVGFDDGSKLNFD